MSAFGRAPVGVPALPEGGGQIGSLARQTPGRIPGESAEPVPGTAASEIAEAMTAGQAVSGSHLPALAGPGPV